MEYASIRGTDTTRSHWISSAVMPYLDHEIVVRPEDEEEDFSQIAENFSKIAEKVRKTVAQSQPFVVPSIYVVPRDLVEGKVDLYEPEVVCMGPLFDQAERRKKPRRKLESYKWCCLRKLLVNAQMSSAGTDDGGQAEDDGWVPGVHEPLLRKCLNTMREVEGKILGCYDNISVVSIGGRDTLALMMLLDGSFLLHRLMMRNETISEDDRSMITMPKIGRPFIWSLVTHDLLLLKNQIPFFILRELFQHLRSRASDKDDVLVEWGLQFFSGLDPGPAGNGGVDASHEKVLHLLHLYHISIIGKLSLGATRSRRNTCHTLCISITCCNNNNMKSKGPFGKARGKTAHGTVAWDRVLSCFPPHKLYQRDPNSATEEDDESTKSRRSSLPWVPCAKELEDAGITFRAKKPKKSAQRDEICSFLDVSFSHGILEIPKLKLYDSSEARFRNLIAFEQTYLPATLHVTAYAMFMECLIKTPEDMRLLHHSGVLENHMGGNDRDAITAGFFSKICAQTYSTCNNNHLANVMNAVVNYQSSKWRRWRAMLKRNYFSNPWVTTSVIAALLLLLMTGLQTFFAVYGYYNPYTRKQ